MNNWSTGDVTSLNRADKTRTYFETLIPLSQ